MENVFKKGKMKQLWEYFTTYEKWWLLIFTALTITASIIFPEETTNGIDGTILTIIYLVNVVLGIFCELLASKQSKWNAYIYIFVEAIEIAKFILLSAMFSSMIVSLFFWLPMHIFTFINWGKHEDAQNKEVTVVRSLKPKYAIMLMIGVVIWTLVLGYIFAYFGPETEFFSSETQKVVVSYLDACLSALSIANGILLYFRFKENWIVWMLYSIVSIVVYAMTGLWVFIILQFGYITNTIYGYLKWTKYIKEKNENNRNENLENNSEAENKDI